MHVNEENHVALPKYTVSVLEEYLFVDGGDKQAKHISCVQSSGREIQRVSFFPLNTEIQIIQECLCNAV
jgi:hypothetical protein